MPSTPFEPFVPRIAADRRLTEQGHVTRNAVTMFVDIAGFTSLSEQLARCGTAGTEQLGTIIRSALGGAIDIVDGAGGDTLAFGGDAITAAFASGDGDDAWGRAEHAGNDIVELVRSLNGEPMLIGPLSLSVKVGIAAGRVTTTICPRVQRDVIVHLGPGLDLAVAAEGEAMPGQVVLHRSDVHADAVGTDAVHTMARRCMPPLLARRVDEGLRPRDEHRRVTVIFVSLPPIDDRDPAALAQLGELVNRSGQLLDELGGELVHCVGGDKGLVLFGTFGAPVAHADDAARAVHFVERLRAGTDTLFRAGISTGPTFVGNIAGTQRAFLGLLGDTVNQGARLMNAAGPGETLIENHTRRAAGDSIIVDDEQLLDVKGKSIPLVVHRVESVTGRIGSFTVGDTPLVGRDQEAVGITRIAAACQNGCGGLVHIEGAAGSGKTRLMAEIAHRLELIGVAIERSRFDGYGLGGSYGPFRTLAAQRLGLADDADAWDLTASLRRVIPGEERAVPLLGEILGIHTDDNGFTEQLAPGDRAELTRRTLVSLLCAVEEPTVLMLEDVHWADEASAAVLAGLVEKVGDTRLSIVTTRRPHEPDQRHIPGLTVELGELDTTALTTIVHDTWSALGGTEIDGDRVDQIVERAAGSPLIAALVCELVRQSWSPGRPIPEIPLHEELLGVLAERLDSLPDDLGELTLRCAIVGREVSASELSDIFDLDSDSVAADLERLETAGLLRSTVGGHALRHATLGEALRSRASHAERSPLHRSMARWLMARSGAPREIAGHLEQAGDANDHLDWIRAARDDARQVWSIREASRWADVTAAADGHTPRDVLSLVELELVLGEVAKAEGHLQALLDDDLKVVERADQRRLLGKLELETGRLSEGVDHLREAERDGATGPDLSWPMAMALCDLGRFDEAEERSRRRLDDPNPHVRLDALANLGAVLFHRGDHAGARRALEHAVTQAEALGDLMRLIHVTGDLAGLHFTAGDLGNALDLLGRAGELAQRVGAHRAMTMVLGNQAQIRIAAGDLTGSERIAAAAAIASIQLPDPGMALMCVETMIVIAEARGEHDRAARWWEGHADLELQLGRGHDAALSTLRLATLLAQAGRRAEADERITEARALLADTDNAEDAALHLERARRASPDLIEAPPEMLDTSIGVVELPPLDTSIPEVTPRSVDDLLVRIGGLVASTPASLSAATPVGST